MKTWSAEDIERRISLSRMGINPKHDVMWDHYRRRPGDYARVLEEQGGGCAVCGGLEPSGRRLAWDHDHHCCPGKKTCGECVRGLLCTACNTTLGLLEDSGRLDGLLEYLLRWHGIKEELDTEVP